MVWFRRSLVAVLATLLPLSAAAAQAVDSLSAGDAGGGAAVVDVAALKAAGVALRLEVSVSERVLRVMAGDSTLRTYAVAVGKSEYPTPRGRFSIGRLVWNPSWVPPASKWARDKRPRGPGDPNNPMGRVKLFFKHPDYYIHGTNNQESLGKAASHGCVRMANEDVVELAQLVMEYGGESRPPTWYHRVLNAVRRSSEVSLAEPMPLRVVE